MKIKLEAPQHLLKKDDIKLPKYASKAINDICQNAQACSTKSIGNLGLLKKEFKGKTYDEFKEFLLNKNPKIIEIAVDKILKKSKEMEYDKLSYVNYHTVKIWVEDLIFVKTFLGLSIELLCFNIISEKFNMDFIKGSSEDDSKGVDGYLNNKPYNVKPSSYKNRHNKSSKVKCDIIYYSINKNILEIEYDKI